MTGWPRHAALTVGLALLGACFVDQGGASGGPTGSTSSPSSASPSSTGGDDTTTTTGGESEPTASATTAPMTSAGTTSGGLGSSSSGVASTSEAVTTGAGTTDAPAAPCDADDPELVACYEFEMGLEDGLAWDGSSYGHHGAAQGVTSGAGIAGAAAFTDQRSLIVIDDAPQHAIMGAFTVAAWVRPEALPETRFGILDRPSSVGLFLYAGGELRCLAQGSTLGVTIPIGAWSHVACVFDGAGELALMLDGDAVVKTVAELGEFKPGSPIVLANDAPAPSAQNAFIGGIDGVRIWSRGLSSAELCAVYPGAC
ncbi:MAG: LamG domain-containing protein [Myxococcales bacterium]|nr:LamG domain-containing protein [Myxococcales bacterium]